jgi:hypothetical protein
MRIVIETNPHKQQRYPTVGGYREDGAWGWYDRYVDELGIKR